MAWTTLCDLNELSEGEGSFFDIDGRELAAFLHKGQPYVMDNTCPHAGGPMSGGYVVVRGVTPCAVCPWHGWEFRLTTGEYHGVPGFAIHVYSARIEVDGERSLVQADLPMP